MHRASAPRPQFDPARFLLRQVRQTDPLARQYSTGELLAVAWSLSCLRRTLLDALFLDRIADRLAFCRHFSPGDRPEYSSLRGVELVRKRLRIYAVANVRSATMAGFFHTCRVGMLADRGNDVQLGAWARAEPRDGRRCVPGVVGRTAFPLAVARSVFASDRQFHLLGSRLRRMAHEKCPRVFGRTACRRHAQRSSVVAG